MINFEVGIDLSNIKKQINTIQKTKMQINPTVDNKNFNKFSNTANDFFKQKFDLNIDTSALDGVVSSISTIKAGFKEIGQGITEMIEGAGLITASLTPLVSKSLGQFKEDTESERKTKTLWGTETSSLEKIISQVAATTGTESKILYGSAYQYLSAGGQKENLKEFLDPVAKCSIATDADVEQTAKSVQVLQNIYGNSYKTEKICSDLCGLIKYGVIDSINDFNTYGIKNMNYAKDLGMSKEEFYGFFANVTRLNGGDTSGATTQISNFLSGISKMTAKEKKVGEKYGLDLSYAGYRQKGLVKYLEDIKNSGLLNNQKDLNAIYGGKNESKFVINAASDIEGLKSAIKNVNNGLNLDEMWGNIKDDPFTKWQQSVVKLQESFRNLGTTIAPVAIDVINKITDIVNKVTEWCNAHPTLLKNITNLIGKLLLVGQVLLIAKGCSLILGGALKVVFGVILTVVGGFKLVTGVMKLFGIASNPMALAVCAALALVAYKIWFIGANFNELKKISIGVLETIISLITKLLQKIIRVGTYLGKIQQEFNEAHPILRTVLGITNPIQTIVGEQFAENGDEWAENVGKISDTTWDAGMDSFKSFDFNALEFNPINWVKEKLGGFNTLNTVTETIGQNLGIDLGDGFNAGLDNFNLNSNNIGDIGDVIDNTVDKATSKTKTAADTIKNKIEEIKNAIKSATSTYESTIKIFEKGENKVVSKDSLLRNAKQKAEQYAELERLKNNLLNNSSFSDTIKGNISQMGIDDLANLKALNRMSAEEIQQWASYYQSGLNTSLSMATTQEIHVSVDGLTKDQSISAIVNSLTQEFKRRGII